MASPSKPVVMPPLVGLTPSDTLVFDVGSTAETKTVLKVTNISSNKIVFKVKTTQPAWYYVKPNQQILDVGQSEDVVIVLIESEGNRFSDFAGEDKKEKLDKHRFMVQSKVLNDNEFSKIAAVPTAQRGEEFSKIWANSPKDDRKNLKLRVDFVFPDSSQQLPTASAARADRIQNVSESVETLRNRIARTDASGAKDAEATGRPEDFYAELLALRKKYDAVVEYTVHLTAERDTIVTQLEETQRQNARDANRTKTDTPKGNAKTEKGNDKKIVQQGFSLLALIITAIMSYLIGRFLKF